MLVNTLPSAAISMSRVKVTLRGIGKVRHWPLAISRRIRLSEAVPVTGGLILELLSVEGAVMKPARRKGGKYSPRKPAQAAAKRRLVRKRR